MKRFAGTGALAAIVVPLIAFAADPCEQFVSATNRSTHPDGYKLLDDRCEGLLYQPTSAGDGLFLVSLLAGNVSPQNNPKIEVSFARPGAGTVHIQAMPRISEVLYRMDVETDKNQYAWPATIPRANALAIADLGIMASIAVSGRPTPVFLPVAVKANAPEDWPKTAILQSKAPMSRVMVKLRAAKYGGGWGSNSLSSTTPSLTGTTGTPKI